MDELKELREMILGLDELVGYWFEGYNANLLSAGGDDVYGQADYYRNRALEIIKKIRKRGLTTSPFSARARLCNLHKK